MTYFWHSFTVTGLKPFTDYEFRVSAENPQGEGNMSLPLYLQTLEAGKCLDGSNFAQLSGSNSVKFKGFPYMVIIPCQDCLVSIFSSSETLFLREIYQLYRPKRHNARRQSLSKLTYDIPRFTKKLRVI